MQRKWVPPSLRTWLFLLTLSAMLPVSLFTASTMVEMENERRQATLSSLDQRVGLVAYQLDDMVQASVSALNALGQTAAARAGDFATLHESARHVLRTNPAFCAITLIDAQGKMVFATPLPYGGDLFPTRNTTLVREAFETGIPNLSGPFVTPISANKLVAVSVPMRHDGKTTHVLRMIILADTISNLLNQDPLPAGWLAGVVDRDGILLARNVDADKLVGQRATQEFLNAMQRKEKAVIHALSLDGAPVTTALVPIHRGDWFLGVSVTDHVLDAPMTARRNGLLALGAIWVLLSVGLSQWMATFLNRQMQALVRAVSAPGDDPRPVRLLVSDLAHLWDAHRATQEADAVLRSNLLQVSKQRDTVEDLYDKAPCGYHSLNQQGKLVNINQTELKWLGHTKADVLGRPFTDFLTEDSRRLYAENFPGFLQRGFVNDLELELVRRDGSLMPVLISANAIRNDRGEFVESRSTLVDITARPGPGSWRSRR